VYIASLSEVLITEFSGLHNYFYHLSLACPDVITFFFFFKKSSIIKPTTLDINEQEAIGGAVANPVACVVSMPPKYQHVVSSLGSEE